MSHPFGIAVIPQTASFTAAGTYSFTVPPNFNTITVTCVDGQYGAGDTGDYGCETPPTPGGPSTFAASGSATYQRQTSPLLLRYTYSVVVGAGGGGASNCAYGNPANGADGSVTIVVA